MVEAMLHCAGARGEVGARGAGNCVLWWYQGSAAVTNVHDVNLAYLKGLICRLTHCRPRCPLLLMFCCLQVFYNSTNPTAAMLLFIAFEFVMNVLLLNVLIASMTNSFSKITQVRQQLSADSVYVVQSYPISHPKLLPTF
jgi:hypothetical protein